MLKVLKTPFRPAGPLPYLPETQRLYRSLTDARFQFFFMFSILHLRVYVYSELLIGGTWNLGGRQAEEYTTSGQCYQFRRQQISPHAEHVSEFMAVLCNFGKSSYTCPYVLVMWTSVLGFLDYLLPCPNEHWPHKSKTNDDAILKPYSLYNGGNCTVSTRSVAIRKFIILSQFEFSSTYLKNFLRQCTFVSGFSFSI